jgi:hypothetical protein
MFSLRFEVGGLPFGLELAGLVAVGPPHAPLGTRIPSCSEGNFPLDEGIGTDLL